MEERLRECEAALTEVEAAYHQMDDRRSAIEIQLVDAFDYIRRLEDLLRWRVDRQKARDEFLAASVRVWREVDRLTAEKGVYPGLPQSTELRQRERAAWDRYRNHLDESDVTPLLDELRAAVVKPEEHQ